MDELAAVDEYFGAVGLGPSAGAHGETRDAGNGGNRLAAKPVAANFKEVGRFPDFAGAMPFEREQSIVRAHTVAIILDPDEAFPALAKLDFDAPGACIEAVLNQFLGHRRGPLDDLAGSDLIGHDIGQYSNGGHLPEKGYTGPKISLLKEKSWEKFAL